MGNYYRFISIYSFLESCIIDGSCNDNIHYLMDTCWYFMNDIIELTLENLLYFKDEILATYEVQYNEPLLKILPVIENIEKELPNV